MEEFKGKPGPWHWEGKVLCNVAHIVGGDGWAFNDADKKLIAAAPDLLEFALAFSRGGKPYHQLEALALTAIAKSLGK